MWLRFRLIEPVGILLAKRGRCRLRHTGEHRAPYKGPFLIVANHQTEMDLFAIGFALRKVLRRSRLTPWAREEKDQRERGLSGWLLWRYIGAVPAYTSGMKENPRAMLRSLELLKRERIILAFPEGRRYPHGELGPFSYDLANLARAVPVPILPVAIWRRAEEDGGIQVNIGDPFFLPDFDTLRQRSSEEGVPAEEDNDSAAGGGGADPFSDRIEELKGPCAKLRHDKQGMELFRSMLELVHGSVRTMENELPDEGVFGSARPEDNEYMRDRVFELLPHGWSRTEATDHDQARDG